MTVRHCFGETVEVYEITGKTQIDVYEAAIKHVKNEKYQSYFQIDTYATYNGWVGVLRVHVDGKHDNN